MKSWFQTLWKVGGFLTLAVLGSALRSMTTVQATGMAEPGNTLSRNDSTVPAESPMPNASGPADDELRFAQFKLFDPMVDNEALRILVPRGWRASGGIAWRHNASNLAVCNLSLADPSGQLAFSYFPCDALCYGDNLAMYGFGPGSNYLGNEVCAPIPRVADYVTNFVLPRYRSSDLRYRVTAVEELPAVADSVLQAIGEPGMQKQVSAARVRIEYERGDRTFEEDVYCTLTFAGGTALPGFLLWGPERLYSFRAPKGQLDSHTPMFQAMATSMTIDLGWFNKYRQVTELWAQRIQNSIRDAGMLSRYIAQINDEITQINRAAWENQQRVMDRVNRQFVNYIRGVEEYQNPYASSTIQLPAGYQRVWANRFNEYYLTNSASFDPNQHSNQQWVELTRLP
jgi:hypothetical protein